jgi:poly-gamma-glutamate capsule biosynthesis protein CapA/YwtB (metallophosphatase superfamily)
MIPLRRHLHWLPFILLSIALQLLGKPVKQPRTDSALDELSNIGLTAKLSGGDMQLNWLPVSGISFWAVLRDSTMEMVFAETLAVTSGWNWLDVQAVNKYQIRFYQVVPYAMQEPDDPTAIENFDDGLITLGSVEGEDDDPNDWQLTNSDFYAGSYALELSGDTWKKEATTPQPLAFNSVWRIAVKLDDLGEVQAFGISDGTNWMRYVLWGSECPQADAWITVYQGWFDANEWVLIDLPVGEDWHGRFGYLPSITELEFINDNDSGSGRILYDEIIDVTDALPFDPVVDFQWSITTHPSPDSIRVDFFTLSYDPDSPSIEHLWNFGDGAHSTATNATHDYPRWGRYTVTLTVTDDGNNASWQSHTFEDPPVEMNRELRAAFTGDIMLARGYESSIIPSSGVESIFEPTLNLLEPVDFTCVNLESPLTTASVRHPTKGIVFKGNPENVDGLVYAGVDYATLANNHIIDYMEAGMLETMSTLDAEGIDHSGAGMNDILARRPAFISRNGLSLAMLGFCNRHGSYLNDQPFLDAGRSRPGFANWHNSAIEATVPEAAALADFVIVNVHSGDEYVTNPDKAGQPDLDPWDPEIITFSEVPDAQERLMRQYALDQGAAILINHHPHVIQGFEVYHGKLIAHSMGNYTFDLNYPECLPTVVLHTHFSAENGVDEAIVHPVFLDHWIPRPATGELARQLLVYESQLSRAFDTWLVRNPGEDSARIVWDTTLVATDGIDLTATLALTEKDGWYVSRAFPVPDNGYPVSADVDGLSGVEIRCGRDALWYGNMEDEGSTNWNLNSSSEGYNEDESHSAPRSIRLMRAYNSGGNVITNLPMSLRYDPEHLYSLCGWIKTENAIDASIQAQLFTTRSSGMLEQVDIDGTLSGDNGWTYKEAELPVYYNAYYVNIRMNLFPPASDTGYAWFDDLVLIQWEEWQAAPVEIPFPSDITYIQVRSSSEAAEADLDYRLEWVP